MRLRLKTVVLTAICALMVSSVQGYASFSFDIDGDGNKDALTDGLLVLRHLFGFSGSTLSEGAVGGDATRSDATALQSHLETNAPYLDIDGDGQNDALTDGLLLLRLLFGFEGDTLVQGAVGADATRTTASSIEDYIDSPVSSFAPSISGLPSTIGVAENQTNVVTVSATDPNGDSITYTLTGTDAAHFTISSAGVITFNTAPDFETRSSYSITVNVSDGTHASSQSVAITVTNANDAPVISGLELSVSVTENQTAVVTVSATDADGDTVTYSLTGTDAADFSIASTGVITFNTAPDFETKSSYEVTVNVGDGTSTINQTLTISVTNANETPTAVALSGTSIAENAAGVTVGTLSSTDVDGGDTFTYTLTGTDASSFEISGATLKLKDSVTADYESQASYAVTVTTTDAGGLTTSEAFTVSVTNVNETPTAVALSGTSIAENAAGVTVGTLSSTDVDAGDTFTYTLTGTDASSFEISGSTLKLMDSVTADYESQTSYAVTVTTTDAGGLTTSEAFTVSVTNVNETPTISGLAPSITAAENQTSVTTISASDPESASLSYSLSGTDASSFSISSTGDISFNVSPDYETKNSYTIAVNVSDGINSDSQTLTINVSDVNESPIFTSLPSTVVVDENTLSVAQVKTLDPENDPLTYALSGTDADSFDVSTAGLISFKASKDFENLANNRFSITVTISDASLSRSRSVYVMVKDVVENQVGESVLGNSTLE